MTAEQINIAIAEACGWKQENDGEFTDGIYWHPNHDRPYLAENLPNFCADLNAMHEAEKTMGFHEEDSDPALDYWIQLGRVVAKPTKEPGKTFTTISEIDKCCATALQRATAFVKALNLEIK